jgi:phosphonopyruvate decarboxylase
MKRDEAVDLIAASKGDGVSVTTMRSVLPWSEAGAAAERHIDCIGCMGGAASLGLGLALAQPQRRVFVIDGDGSLLMQLGGLASVAGAEPANFYHFVLVNRVYETSGQQVTPGGDKVDFAALARGAGYRQAERFNDLGVLRERLPGVLSTPGPALIALEVDPEDYGESTPRIRPRDAAGALRSQLAHS